VQDAVEQDLPLARLGSAHQNKDRLVAAPALLFSGIDLAQIGGRDLLHGIQWMHNYGHVAAGRRLLSEKAAGQH